MRGITGIVIEVDLSTGGHRFLSLDNHVYKMFLGGRGLATYLLSKSQGHEWRDLDPLSPDNPLIIATGPLTGFYPGIKITISGKSPQSNGIVGSSISTELGIELKAAGYDAIIVKGASNNPVYINIEDNKVEIRDASDLWGLTGKKFIEKMAELFKREHGYERPPGMIYIGPGGENRVRTATIMSKLAHAAGYGGYGAVMGSKKLKAIIVKGNNPLPRVHDQEKLIELREKAIESLKDRLARFRQWGTTMGTWYHGFSTSSIPIRNWQEEYHSHLDFSPAGFESKVWVKNPWADHGCPVGCMKLSRVMRENQHYLTDAPDYEMAAYLGANLGIFDPEDVARLSSVADDLGLCGIQTGNVIGFAIELFEKGFLKRDDVGYDLRWGDANIVERMLNDIAYRRGIGDQLAEGTYRFAKWIEKIKNIDALKYAVQVKGIGVGAHGIRSGKDYPQIIAYACSVQGGDHTSVAGLPAKSTESESWIAILDSAVVCLFLDLGDQFVLEYLNAVTGWNLDLDGLYDIGNRILTLQRLLLLLGGPDTCWNPLIHDENPERFYEPLPSGPYSGFKVDRDKVVEAKRKYYEQLGWDENGIPKMETLEKLGLAEFEYLINELHKGPGKCL